MAQSILGKLKPLGSLIDAQAAMNPKKPRTKNSNLAFSLNLTALIDAFAILVIFLLSNYSGDSQNLDFSAQTQLPKASHSKIMSMGTVVKIESTGYSVDDKKVNLEHIVQALIDARKNKKDQSEDIQKSLIIIADKRMDFSFLSPVIRAAGQAGFESYKFAVIPGRLAGN